MGEVCIYVGPNILRIVCCLLIACGPSVGRYSRYSRCVQYVQYEACTVCTVCTIFTVCTICTYVRVHVVLVPNSQSLVPGTWYLIPNIPNTNSLIVDFIKIQTSSKSNAACFKSKAPAARKPSRKRGMGAPIHINIVSRP